jgi:allophanate hydrolase subunit 1
MKERARRDTEIALAKALKQLEKEKEKLEIYKNLLLEAQKKIKDTDATMREVLFGGQAQAVMPQRYLDYLRKLRVEESALESQYDDQSIEVDYCMDRLKRARKQYSLACQEENMMKKHKDLWKKKLDHQLSMAEEKMLGELGNTIFQINRVSST